MSTSHRSSRKLCRSMARRMRSRGFRTGVTICAKSWSLAQLFVQPAVHATGVGQGLLKRARDYGRARGARVFAVSSSTSRSAQALYMRHGMFANAINYDLSGPVEPLLRLPEPEANKK